MEIKERIFADFSAGNMKNVDPLLIPDNALSDSNNCYVDDTNTLVSRELFQEVSTGLTDWSQGLAELVDHYYITKMFKWDYTIIPSTTNETFGFIAYGDNKIFYFFRETSGVWSAYGSSYLFTGISEPYFTKVYSGVMLVDGRYNNNAKIMFIDKDRTFQTTAVKNYSSNHIIDSDDTSITIVSNTDTITGMTEIAGSILQYVYTIKLNDQTETNPSPIYSNSWIQFIERDIDTYGYNSYIQKLKLTDIDIPTELLSNAEKIAVYRRSTLFSEQASDIGVFTLVKEFDVTSDTTGLSITDSNPESNIEISYDKASDLAGDDICNVNNVIFVANARSKTNFPVTLPEWYEIHININEQYPIVDAKFLLSSSCLLDFIDSGDWDIFFSLSDWKQRIRFYHNDALTPLPVAVNKSGDYEVAEGDDIPTFYLRSPLIPNGQDYVVYMGIDIDGSGTALTNTDYLYGYPADATNSTEMTDIYPVLYQGRRVLNSNNMVVLNLEPQTGTTSSYVKNNRSTGFDFISYEPGSDDSSYERTTPSAHIIDNTRVPYEKTRRTDLEIGRATYGKALKVDTYSGQNYYYKHKQMPIFFGDDKDANAETTIVGFSVSTGSLTFTIGSKTYYYICGYNGNNPYLDTDLYGSYVCIASESVGTLSTRKITVILKYRTSSGYVSKELFNYQWSYSVDDYITFDLALSTRGNPVIAGGNNVYALGVVTFGADQKIHTITTSSADIYEFGSSVTYGSAYFIGHPRTGEFGSSYAPFIINYLSWEHSKFITDFNVLHNKLFNLTSFELGTLETPDAYWEGSSKEYLSQEGTSATVFDLEFEQDNYLRWSTVNGYSFPLLNSIKLPEPAVRIIPAPSFLMQNYRNTLLVFMRSKLLRIQLSDDTLQPVIIKDLLEEQNQFGIKNRDSLITVENSFYWNSDKGIVKYSPDSSVPVLISQNIKSSFTSPIPVYDSINNFIMFGESGSASTQYVYDIDRNIWWYYTIIELEKLIEMKSYFYYNNVLYTITKRDTDSTYYYRITKQSSTKIDGVYVSMTTKKLSARQLFGTITTKLRNMFINFAKTNATPTNTTVTITGSSPNFTSDQTATVIVSTTAGSKFPVPPIVTEFFKIKIDNFSKITMFNLRGK